MSDQLTLSVVPFHTDGSPQACLMPMPMKAAEAKIYRTIRALHCDRKAASHDCVGRVILDRNGITLSCPLCGDQRSTYPRDGASS